MKAGGREIRRGWAEVDVGSAVEGGVRDPTIGKLGAGGIRHKEVGGGGLCVEQRGACGEKGV